MKRVIYSIQPLYQYLGDDSELPQFYIVRCVFYYGILVRRKIIGQDLIKTPFQDIESVEEYLQMIL